MESDSRDIKAVKDHFNKLAREFQRASVKPSKKLDNAPSFCEKAFGDEQDDICDRAYCKSIFSVIYRKVRLSKIL